MQLTEVRHNKRTLEATLEHVARTRPVTEGVRHLEVLSSAEVLVAHRTYTVERTWMHVTYAIQFVFSRSISRFSFSSTIQLPVDNILKTQSVCP